MVEIPLSFYHQPTEQLRGILGQNYITNIVFEKQYSKSLMVLTDMRVYQTGKVFEKSFNNKIVSTEGKKVVSVKDITGTSFTQSKHIGALIIGLLLASLGIPSTIGGLMNGEAVSIILGFLFLLVAIFFILLFFMSYDRWFIIEYAGGAIATKCKWYKYDEIEEFQKRISLEKDRINNSTK